MAFALGLFGQNTLHLLPIEGTPDDNVAPEGWTIEEISPDIIAGNGPWPNGVYTVADVNGGTVSGESMGLFLSSDTSILEGWETTFSNLKIGTSYSFALQWQQATLFSGSELWYQGGELLVMVDGDSTVFRSKNDVSDDWQVAKVNFTAVSETTTVVIKIHISPQSYTGVYGGAIVLDNVCQECHEAGMW